jgi:tetratricopeptide (TPR) repeat protein
MANTSLLDQGADYYNEGNYTEAVRMYEKAVLENENPALAYYNMGNAYFKLDAVPAAITRYRYAILESPAFLRPYYNLAVLYFSREAYPEAIAILERARNVDAKLPGKMKTLLATAYYTIAEYPRAVPLLTQLAEEDTTAAKIHHMLYRIYIELNDRETALSWIKRHPQKREEDFYDKYTILSDHAFEDGNYLQALHYLERIQQQGYARKWDLYRTVEILAHMERPSLAILQAHSFLREHNNFHQLALLAGNTAFDAGLYTEAEYFYTAAVHAGSPQGMTGLHNILKIYEQLSFLRDKENLETKIDSLEKH